jgi:hypothetical protein
MGLKAWGMEQGAKSLEKNTMLPAPCSLLLACNIPYLRLKEPASLNHFRFSRFDGIKIRFYHAKKHINPPFRDRTPLSLG